MDWIRIGIRFIWSGLVVSCIDGDYSLQSYSFKNGCPPLSPAMYRSSASAQLITFQMPLAYEALSFKYYWFISIEDGRWKMDEEEKYLEVVSMLPHIHPKDGRRPRHRILVVGRGNVQLSLGSVGHQPTPSAALNAQQGRVERILKLIEGSPALLDGRLEGRCLIDLAPPGLLRGQILPEEGVVDVATAVEFDRLLHGDELGNVVGLRGSLLRIERGVQAIDVGLMVLFVVQLHDLLGDVGFKGLALLVCCHFFWRHRDLHCRGRGGVGACIGVPWCW